MSSVSWVETVQQNVARYGELVVGIDPSPSDVPSFFEEDGAAWISRFVDFILDAIEGQVGFVKFQSAYFEAGGLSGPHGPLPWHETRQGSWHGRDPGR
ncbi:beta/alpha barrel domain-containing protein [Sinorhizobium meliloti]|uniref:hypothetical protein n=1 Tax=Rhizobium meliloti TaxID=382 RepID=UPI001F15F766|nr:hypothetical protein [Sinorhizobium meliloti]